MQLNNMLKFPMAWTGAAGPDAAAVLSTRVRIARNLAGFTFPERSSQQVLKEVFHLCTGAFKKTKALSKAAYIMLEDTDRTDRRFLIERHQISPQLAAETKNRAVIIGAGETLSAMINEEDHIRIQAISSGFSPAETLAKAMTLDDELGRRIDYAYNDKLGFLTACPTNIGTGLRISCLVHLPALTRAGQVQRVLENLSQIRMTARGLYGEGTSAIGDFYQISNATCLGNTEDQFAENLMQVIQSLITREQRTRKGLLEEPRRTGTEDAVFRALGVLEKARSISYQEAMQNFSLVRMGLSMVPETPVDLPCLNELMIITQPAHLQMASTREMSPAERDAERASLIRKRFSA
ncbi:MAG: protein arginine kinase [bacterium]